MKNRIVNRVIVAVAGVVLVALCVAIAAEAFFAVPVMETLASALSGKKALVWLPYVLIALLLALGVCCVLMVYGFRKAKRGFVLQDTDGGELSIALSAMDGLVQQCVAVHREMTLISSGVNTDRDGVAVDLRISVANGVSVPLAIDALQKQIRQYVTSCSGVTVREVRIQVDSMDDQPVETPYAVPAMLQSAVPAPALMRGESAPAAADGAEEEKPLHQRLFSDDEPAEAADPVAEEESPDEEAAAEAAVMADLAIEAEEVEAEEAEAVEEAETDSEADEAAEEAAPEAENEVVEEEKLTEVEPVADEEPAQEPAEAVEPEDAVAAEPAEEAADETAE